MKQQRRRYDMSERELRSYRRMLRLRRERRNRVLLSALGLWAAVCTIIISSIFLHSVKSNASDGFKYYTSVTIESGDTLWNIADDYIDYSHYKNKDSYISEVKSINHLDENGSITAGQLLILPYYSEEYIE